MPFDLTSDDGLRAACQTLQPPETWGEEGKPWIPLLAETLRWVKAADEAERSTVEFQQRLWEDNHVAAVGMGTVSVAKAIASDEFRAWLAARSMQTLPTFHDERVRFLSEFYDELQARLKPLTSAMPHLKIFRVMAALYPEAMTTIASRGALRDLVKVMGAPKLYALERHLWVRERLDASLGKSGEGMSELAHRLSLPWMLYEKLLKNPSAPNPNLPEELTPLPAARRRRGLTPIKGMFQGSLSALEFLRDGVTRQELLDFFRASSPEAKEASLGMSVNVLQSELGAIRLDGDRYVLTDRGEDVLESQDATPLANWILTRILGPDRVLVELRERREVSPAELIAIVRGMNPGLKSNFVPQAVVSWLRSMGVIELNGESRHVLTDMGHQWASMITWTPESLPVDEPPVQPVVGAKIELPSLVGIIAAVQAAGHFPPDQVARLHAGLWSHSRRHFAILTGLSGSGKTLLARSYAKALTVGGEETPLLTLPVQPGWYDPGALLGYTNPLRGDSYVRTPFVEFLIGASGDPGRPYVTVLDEMNLSHPEQYMAPLLSAMETGDVIQLHTEDEVFDGIPSKIPYPENLVIIGTVNMDETTHGLSDKVLDRAFVLEFWHVDLDSYPRWGKSGLNSENEASARAVLTALMKALAPARLHFGWRVVDDVLDFLAQASMAGAALPFEPALDSVVYAKVLPKLRGEDASRFRTALVGCEEVLAKHGLEGSRAKVLELRQDLESTGSARFWR